jgi:hypothetical protein
VSYAIMALLKMGINAFQFKERRSKRNNLNF